jgi:hypothetical protein
MLLLDPSVMGRVRVPIFSGRGVIFGELGRKSPRKLRKGGPFNNHKMYLPPEKMKKGVVMKNCKILR